MEMERLACSGGVFREMEATLDPSSPVFMRKVEAFSDPPSPALASGKGVSFRFAFAGFQLWRAEATKVPRFHLGSRGSLGKGY